jgi:uncharacterized protein YfeS
MAELKTWELTRKQAHPKARALLNKAFYWDEDDENSPLGNETGHDTGAKYQEWCSYERRAGVRRFLEELMQGWGVADSEWDVLDPERLASQLKQDAFQILTRDDLALGLAFAQMILDGKVDPEVKRIAQLAAERQSLDAVIAFRRWRNPKQRKARLQHMQSVLAQDWS